MMPPKGKSTETLQSAEEEGVWVVVMTYITFLSDRFETYGRFIFRNRWQVAILSFLFNGMLGLGLLSLNLNNDTEDLYVTKNTETNRLTAELLQIFPDTSGRDFRTHASIKYPLFVDVIVSSKGTDNMLQPHLINESKTLVDMITNFEFNSKYLGLITYQSVCARNSGQCVTSGTEILPEVGDCNNEDTCTVGLNNLETKYGKEQVTEMLQHMGNYSAHDDHIIDARYFKFRFYLRQDTSGRSNDSIRWIGETLKVLKKVKTKHIDIVYSHSKSFYEELGNDTYRDIPFFALTFTVMLTYFGFLISGGDCVSKRVNIGRMGSIVVPLSVLGSWGLIVGTGTQFTNITGVMPYVALFFEVNNMLVTLSAVSDLSELSKAEDRTARALKTSGIPITMTTLTYVSTFSAGANSEFLVLRLFSIFTVGTLLFVYFNHMVFFMACLSIHEQRIDDNRHFCTCNTLQSKEEGKANGRSCCFLCCCTGGGAVNRDSAATNMEKLTRIFLSRFILHRYVRWFGVVTFLGYLGVSIWLAVNFKVATFKEKLVTSDSYFSKFHAINSQQFSTDFYLTFTLPGNYDYTDPATIGLLSNMKHQLADNRNINPTSLTSWFEAYSDSEFRNLSSEAAFTPSLKEFLKAQPTFTNDISFDENGTITASRFYCKTRGIHSYDDHIRLKESLLDHKVITDEDDDFRENLHRGRGKRRLDDDDSDGHDDAKTEIDGNDVDDDEIHDAIMASSISPSSTGGSNSSKFSMTGTKNAIVLHSPVFLYTDNYNSPLKQSAIIIGIQVAVSLLLITLACPNPLSFIHGLFWYASIWVGIIGFFVLFDVNMDSVSMVIIITCSCYAVDVVTHTLTSFYYTFGIDRLSRATEVLSTTGVILFHTTLGSFLGLLVLLLEKSYVFITVFKVLSVASAVCFLHAFLFIPIGLSFFGTRSSACSEIKSSTGEGRSIKISESLNMTLEIPNTIGKTKIIENGTHPDAQEFGVDNKTFQYNERF